MASPKKPPFERTSTTINLLGETLRMIGRYEGLMQPVPQPKLRRQNQIKTIAATTAIEGNTLSLEQVTAVFEGKRVTGPQKDIIEVQNAISAYSRAGDYNPNKISSLLKAHKSLLKNLLPDAGKFRSDNVGIFQGKKVVHTAPPAQRVRALTENLLKWSASEKEEHPLIVSAVVHYELAFIHPFMDGNGRTARFWQHLMLLNYEPVFEFVPMESMIEKQQKEYYKSLRKSDKAGNSTPFIEFSLQALHDSLKELLVDLRAPRLTGDGRLAQAKKQLKGAFFGRKEYMKLFKDLSSAQASRDLRKGLSEGLLKTKGNAALTKYRFKG